MNAQQKIIEELLALTDIEVNGSRPWDIRVSNNFYSRILKGWHLNGSAGFGARYPAGIRRSGPGSSAESNASLR